MPLASARAVNLSAPQPDSNYCNPATTGNRSIALKPEYAEAYNNLAIILVKQERGDEAIANYHKALRLKPEYPEAHKNLAAANAFVTEVLSPKGQATLRAAGFGKP